MDANNVRQRLEQVVVQCGFNLVTEKSDKLSHYYEFRHKGALTMTVIRISNHCTDISTWRERYGSINPTIQLSNKEKRRYRGNYAGLNDKYFQKYFFSIVVFDPTTDGVQNCGDVNDGSIFVKQIVYDATKMTNENLVDCENFVKKIASGNITENINYNRIIQLEKILNEGRGSFGGIVDMVTEKFNDFYMSHKNEIDDHINNIKESGDYNDLETRLAWDIARALRYWEWMPKDEQGYVGGTDAQCTTLFKQSLRKSEIPY